ncbi:MAG: leucine-rich repeat protein [Lachnospiraceae bacterium]|nr:leucine-rich repeat protein [Lachnospiraceae bacterium]
MSFKKFKKVLAFVLALSMCMTYVPFSAPKSASAGVSVVDWYISTPSEDNIYWGNAPSCYAYSHAFVGDKISIDCPLDIPSGYTADYQWYVAGDEIAEADVTDEDITVNKVAKIMYNSSPTTNTKILEPIDGATKSDFDHTITEDDFMYADTDGDYWTDSAYYFLQVKLTKGSDVTYEYYSYIVFEEFTHYAVYNSNESSNTIEAEPGEDVTIIGPKFNSNYYNYTYSWTKTSDSSKLDSETNVYTIEDFEAGDADTYRLTVKIMRKGSDYKDYNVTSMNYYYTVGATTEPIESKEQVLVDVSNEYSPLETTVYVPINDSYTFENNVSVVGDNGKSTITYQWYRGSTLIDDETDDTFVFEPTADEDYNGSVTCKATINLDTSESADANYVFRDTKKTTKTVSTVWTVKKAPGLSIINTSDTTVSAKIGDKVELNVNAESSYGDITYKWYMNGSIIKGAEESSYNATAYSGSTTYKCELTDGIDTSKVEFKVNGRIDYMYAFNKGTTSFNKAIGEDVRFNPIFTSYSDNITYKIDWYKSVNGDFRAISGVDTDYFDIDNITEGDFGTYVAYLTVYLDGVVAYKTYEYYTLTERSDSAYPSYINYSIYAYGDTSGTDTYYPGTDVDITVVGDKKTDATYRWIFYPSGMGSDESSNKVGKVLDETGNSLKIEDLSPDKSGVYTAVITYETSSGTKTTTMSKAVYCGNMGDINYTIEKEYNFADIGDSVTLKINATCSGSERIEYQWCMYDSNTDSVKVIDGATKDTYTIKSVKEEDFGAYFVHIDAYNDTTGEFAGDTTSSIYLASLEDAMGVDDTIDDCYYYVTEGEDLTITIDNPVDGYFTYDFYNPDGILIQSSSKNTYIIKDISAGDFGSYTCKISNTEGYYYNVEIYVYSKADVHFKNIGKDAVKGYTYVGYLTDGYIENLIQKDWQSRINIDEDTLKLRRFKEGEIDYDIESSYLLGEAVVEDVYITEDVTKELSVNAKSDLGKDVKYLWYKVTEDDGIEYVSGGNSNSINVIIDDYEVESNDYYSYVCVAYTDASYALYQYAIKEDIGAHFGVESSEELIQYVTEADEEVTLKASLPDGEKLSDYPLATWMSMDLNDDFEYKLLGKASDLTYTVNLKDAPFYEISDGVSVALYGLSLDFTKPDYAVFAVVKVDPEKLKSENQPGLNVRNDILNLVSKYLSQTQAPRPEDILGDVASKLVQTYTQPGAEKISLTFNKDYSVDIDPIDFCDFYLVAIDGNGNKTYYDSANDIAGKTVEFEGDTVTFCYGIKNFDGEKVEELVKKYNEVKSPVALLAPYIPAIIGDYGYQIAAKDSYEELAKRVEELEKYAGITPSADPSESSSANPSGSATTPTDSSVDPSTNPSASPSADTSIVGKTFTYKNAKYKVLSNNTAALVKITKTSLKKFTIPATVKYSNKTLKVVQMNKNSVKGMKKLKTLTIGKNMKKILANAIVKCPKLSKVIIKGNNIKSIGKNAFAGVKKKCVVKVPKKKKAAYKKLLKKAKALKRVKVK